MAWEIRTDRIAEGDIERLCRLQRGRVTRVNEDENGWDLLVEFPPALETAFPDEDPPLRRCIIQVKSAQSRRASSKVKLSNALALAKDPLPCFIILLTYPGKAEQFEAAYLQHVWGTPMMSALLKTCQASAAGKPLHKQFIPIRFKPSDRYDHDVASALLKAIDEIGPEYAEKKRKLREAMGYEDGSGELTFTLEGEAALKDLDDLFLGLRQVVPIASVKYVRKRFNILGPEQLLGSAKLSLVDESIEKCVLSLHRGDEELLWPGEVFKGLDFLPLESRRMRFVGGPLSVVMSGDRRVAATWSAPIGRRRPLDELVREVRLRSWMDGATLFLSIWTERGEFPPVALTFENDDGEEVWPDILRAITALAGIVPSERRPSDLSASLQEIAVNLASHLTFARLCDAEVHNVRIVLNDRTDVQLGDVTHILAPWATRLGDYYLVAIVERRVTDIRSSGGEIDLETRDGKILRGTAIKASEASETLLAREVRWAREKAKHSGRRILSFLPEKGGSGTFELTWDDDADEVDETGR